MNQMKGFLNQVGGYFNNSKSGGQGVSTHDVPQQHVIRGRVIQEEKILSEGGFGYIWKAYDVNTRESFALKRMICQGEDRVQIARRELKNFESLPNHPNIIRFYGGSITPTRDGCIALFLMELCDGGSLFDLMSQTMPNKIPERKLIHIIYEAAKGIRALHQAYPPITHRDIKIENILQSGGVYKLCDFGSCSTQTIDFRNVPKSEYENYEDLFNKSTTLMYRPPEMCDPSKKMLVDTQVDVWMLGCVLYTIAFYIHPFVDSSKLAIVDANYRFPADSKYSQKFHDFIRHMITPDPSFRPTIHDVIQICENYDGISSVQLNPVAQSLKEKEMAREREEKKYEQSGRSIKKFDGDIPLDELMKLQQKIRANKVDDDEDDESNGTSFIKKKKPMKSKDVQAEKQLEQIRQQFNKPSNQGSTFSSNQFWGNSNNNNNQQQQQNQPNRPNSNQNQNNQVIQNEFWNFNNTQNNNQQQQQNKNFQQQNQVSDPFSQFGFGQNSSSNNNNNNNQQSNPFDNFNFNQNNNNNNSNSNSVFDQFGFQNNGINNQQNYNNNMNNAQFNSNPNSFNNNNINNGQNIWEFYENPNDNNNNNNNNTGQQAFNSFNQNQQFGSQSSNSNQQQAVRQNVDAFAQFNSNNQNKSYGSNSQNQNVQQQQQYPQNQNINLLDLDEDYTKKTQTNQGGCVNLLDL
ncbi:protein kinase (macronuclear) [Tetrahymena thermophila SB210]|uniref:non-specific serine/threonine protein kinase n=1 Tax=Tetrahymena thermophila (strain SB210) TaxID=312017 RepID=Q23NJ0_TETTS|nr:protein kinase [Tetrahymena thermophila SB210]EAR98084.1 protein kinase [Tetrahymena thermophila SB210]|eukprot:XP_001018329.1 protein kinase [Tetrahymena thermophila SB210]